MSDDKVKALDDLIIQTEQLKNMIIGEISKVNDTMTDNLSKLGGSDPKALKNSINSLKTFLQSSTNMMNSLSNQVKKLTQEILKIKTTMDQVGKAFK